MTAGTGIRAKGCLERGEVQSMDSDLTSDECCESALEIGQEAHPERHPDASGRDTIDRKHHPGHFVRVWSIPLFEQLTDKQPRAKQGGVKKHGSV